MNPSPFIVIPRAVLPDGRVVPEFSVSKFLARRNDVGDLLLASDAGSSTPWTDVSYRTSSALANRNGFAMLTDSQYLSIAFQICETNENWSGGIKWQGELKGVVDGIERVADGVVHLPAFKIGEDVIHEFGHGYLTLIHDDIQGDAAGVVATPFSADSTSIASFGSGYDESEGIPYPVPGVNWSGNVIMRGGIVSGETGAPRLVMLHIWPAGSSPSASFRLTKTSTQVGRVLKLVEPAALELVA